MSRCELCGNPPEPQHLLHRIHDLQRRLRRAQNAKRDARRQAERLRAQIRDLKPDAEAQRRWQAHVSRQVTRAGIVASERPVGSSRTVVSLRKVPPASSLPLESVSADNRHEED